MWYLYSKKKLNEKTPYKEYIEGTKTFLHKLIFMSLPLTLSGLLNAIIRFFNMILIPNKLIIAGYSSSEAMATIGRIMGMTMTLIGLPFIVTNALVVNLIPSLTEQMVHKKYREIRADIQLSLKVTLLVSIPLALIYIILSKPIAIFLYNDIIVAEYIKIMGLATILLGLQHNLAGILYGINKQNSATFNRLIGMIIQILLIYTLVGNPMFGPYGIFISYYGSFIVVMTLDAMVLKKLIKLDFNYIDILGKPLLASAFMIILVYITNYDLGNLQNTSPLLFLLSLAIGALAYIFVLTLTRAIPKNLFKKLLRN
ncbi:polysaccharide biosynthesis C-terminal domain-containing protein [Tissierella sp. Yu-01]|uniref:MATE family efflux transporter n=1 Tax=Tissierella sp. Yu-01 TaxID=3035694 RepID=UPI00240D81DE|nr:polysaccharide biosynthesis C-terminal domain-containing protein [Tissierella sp. Yu-01]WFA08992.1 polysaccharide biosynthesis C-terminal domain-containing protein [Tissierella sp. Yu-01]